MAVFGQPGVTLTDLRVYAYIDHRCGKRGYWYGPQREIAADMEISERAVRESVGRLVDWGYLETERQGIKRGTVLLYTMVPVMAAVPDHGEADRDDDREMRPTGTVVPIAQGPTGTPVPIGVDRPEPQFRSDRNAGSAAIEEPTAPSPAPDPEPTAPEEIPPPPRALRLVEPVAIDVDRHRIDEPVNPHLNDAYAGLAQLVAELCGWLAPSASVSDQLLAWARDLSPEDVFRIRRECQEAVASDRSGRRGNAWALVKAVAGRVYAARRARRDPWAEPRPGAPSSRRPGNAMPPRPAHASTIAGNVAVGFTSDGRLIRRRDVARGHLEDGSPIPAEITS